MKLTPAQTEAHEWEDEPRDHIFQGRPAGFGKKCKHCDAMKPHDWFFYPGQENLKCTKSPAT